MKKIFSLLIGSCYFIMAYPQNIGVGTTTPDASAKLDITAPDKGVLVPRISISNVSVSTPVSAAATGLLVWNTNAGTIGGNGTGFYFWDGTKWQKVLAGSEGWKLSGNNGTNPATHFIGTTDDVPLIFRVNNIVSGKIEPSMKNIFLGREAGSNVLFLGGESGKKNILIGDSAGRNVHQGFNNILIGNLAGFGLDPGVFGGLDNIFIGHYSGYSVRWGFENTSIGDHSGFKIGTAEKNTFLGFNAGYNTDGGDQNVFIGHSAGFLNTSGNQNNFFGNNAGFNTTSGFSNLFMGDSSGSTNSTGDFNTLVGPLSDLGSGNLSNASALGYKSYVTASNSLVLGSINGINGANADTKVGIGTTAPKARLHIFQGSSGSVTLFPDAVLESNDNVYLNVITVNNKESGILFGKTSNSASGGIIYNSASMLDGFQFRTNGNITRMVLTDNGELGIGTPAPTEKLQVEGNIKLNGELNRPSTGTANMVSICYGTVSSTGVTLGGSGNFTVNNSSVGNYEIMIMGETYNSNTYATSVTPIAAVARMATALTAGGSLLVRIFDNSGALINTSFHFVVYKP